MEDDTCCRVEGGVGVVWRWVEGLWRVVWKSKISQGMRDGGLWFLVIVWWLSADRLVIVAAGCSRLPDRERHREGWMVDVG